MAALGTLKADAIENDAGETPFQPTLTSSVDTSTGATSYDVTGIPSWVTKITIVFDHVSVSGTDDVDVLIGDSGGVETTGYDGESYLTNVTPSPTVTTSTAAFPIRSAAGTYEHTGVMTLYHVGSNEWIMNAHTRAMNSNHTMLGAGSKTLSGTLDRIRVKSSGTDTFDAGNFTVIYE